MSGMNGTARRGALLGAGLTLTALMSLAALLWIPLSSRAQKTAGSAEPRVEIPPDRAARLCAAASQAPARLSDAKLEALLGMSAGAAARLPSGGWRLSCPSSSGNPALDFELRAARDPDGVWSARRPQ